MMKAAADETKVHRLAPSLKRLGGTVPFADRPVLLLGWDTRPVAGDYPRETNSLNLAMQTLEASD